LFCLWVSRSLLSGQNFSNFSLWLAVVFNLNPWVPGGAVRKEKRGGGIKNNPSVSSLCKLNSAPHRNKVTVTIIAKTIAQIVSCDTITII
jgi:hypothetical protein